MRSEIVFVVAELPTGVFEARALGHSILTDADNQSELRKMVRDAVSCHFDETDRPEIIRLLFVREEVIEA